MVAAKAEVREALREETSQPRYPGNITSANEMRVFIVADDGL